MADKKAGRPKKHISQKQFESLCIIQCTREEICAVLDVSDKTLDKWCKETYGDYFSVIFSQKRNGGKASLRRNQWKMAETNPTMAIWLGKQYLGQRDKEKEEANKAEKDVAAALRGLISEINTKAD